MMNEEPSPDGLETPETEVPATEPEPSAGGAQAQEAGSDAPKAGQEGAELEEGSGASETKAKPRKRTERKSTGQAKKSAAETDAAAGVEEAAPPAPAKTSVREEEAEQAGEATPAAGEPIAQDAEAAEPRVGQESRPEPAAAPRSKSEVPGAHLEVDIVPEGVDPLGRARPEDPYAVDFEEEGEEVGEEEPEPPSVEAEQELAQPIVSAAIDLAADARYRATGKRKTAVARVILRPGGGAYTINGRALDDYFPRATLQRNICQPLEAVGYQDRMDVLARLHGGGVSSQAGALRHGISRALLEADPSLRVELKRRGFLTRDSRVKERKKAGLKKARKRPQFSKR
jgi:small subunit ribosomal protein S9